MRNDTLQPEKAALVVLVAAFIGVVLTMTSMLGWSVVQTDILQDNPHRSLSHALLTVPLMGSLLGVISVFVFYALALIAAMTWSGFLASKYGSVPFIAFFSAVPVYWVLIYVQYRLLPEFRLFTEPPGLEYPSAVDVSTRLFLAMLPTLFFTWLCLKRFSLGSESKATSRD